MKIIKSLFFVVLTCSLALRAENDSTRLTCPVDDRVTCNEILQQIADLRASLTDCSAQIEACLLDTETVIDALITPTCDIATAIAQTDMPYTITAPGQYCLVESVTGTLTIDADDVLVNLNGFKISGGTPDNIFVQSRQNITITNGIIGNAGVIGNGIRFNNCTTVVVTDIKFQQSDIGCRFDATNGIRLHNCSFKDHVGVEAGTIIFENASNGKVTSCQISGGQRPSGLAVVRLLNSSNISFFDVNVADYIGTSINYFSSISCDSIIFTDCSVQQKVGELAQLSFLFNNCSSSGCFNCTEFSWGGFGFFVSNSSSKILLDHCKSVNRINGATAFLLTNCSDCCIVDCIQEGNAVGYRVNSTSNCLVLNCVAKANLTFPGIGFDTVSSSTSAFLGNYAQNNTTNYNGFPSTYSKTTFTSGAFARYGSGALTTPTDWDNIDII